ncbi:HAD family hydrolase [Promicromonospora sp. NPDC057488]|uniref:HAD family hydrolase n=1 Tax=Promicromonospora sp. NPDC057488 TaxID=3346147 RepID=UPI00366F9E93
MVAFDIDGTLVPDGGINVPDETVEVMTATTRAGHHIVLATGRSLAGALPVAQALGLEDATIAASNGAITANLDAAWPGGYQIQHCHTLAAGPVLRLARDLGADLQVAAEDVGWGYHVSEIFSPGRLNGRQYLVGESELHRVQTPRLVLAGPDVATLARDAVAALGVTVNAVGPHWLDVTPPGVSKATALEAVRAELGVAAEHTVFVGDGVNDLPALAWAARSVAMGQAPDKVRRAAHHVTGTLEENGAVAVLHELLGVPAISGAAS